MLSQRYRISVNHRHWTKKIDSCVTHVSHPVKWDDCLSIIAGIWHYLTSDVICVIWLIWAKLVPKKSIAPIKCWRIFNSLHWRHNDHDGVLNHQPRDCLLNLLFRCRSKKISKLRVTDLCVGNSPGPVNSPHKGPVTRKMFPFDDVIMWTRTLRNKLTHYFAHVVICWNCTGCSDHRCDTEAAVR